MSLFPRLVANQNGNVTIVGGIACSLAAKTAAYTLTTDDTTVTGDATSAAFAVTLPAASSVPAGREFTLKKIDSGTNHVTLTAAGSDLIDGAATSVLTTQYAKVTVRCDGVANWWIVA